LLYGRLFLEDKEAAALFRGVNMKSQGAKLAGMFTTAVAHLEHPMFETLVEMGRGLGHVHRKFGVKRHHFDSVSRALMWTLGQGLGPKFDRETRAAWTWFYSIIADIMCGGLETETAAANNLLYGVATICLATAPSCTTSPTQRSKALLSPRSRNAGALSPRSGNPASKGALSPRSHNPVSQRAALSPRSPPRQSKALLGPAGSVGSPDSSPSAPVRPLRLRRATPLPPGETSARGPIAADGAIGPTRAFVKD
jgi:hemoglobin-like flavoprotein